MENLNRIKGSLADAGKTCAWLAGQLGKDSLTASKWCTNTTQPIGRHWQRFPLQKNNKRKLLINRN